MRITVKNGIKPWGTVILPPSKSEAIRALLLAGICGERLYFPEPMCGDVRNASRAAVMKRPYVGESAALLRMLIPIRLAVFGEAEVSCEKGLIRRGIGELEECLGVRARKIGNRIRIKKKLAPGRYEIDCSRSSQFLSGLLMALPLLEGRSEIIIKNGLVSRPYADMTVDFVRRFGGDVRLGSEGYEVFPSVYRTPSALPISGDRSYAAVFEAMNFLGGDVSFIGLTEDTRQPDKRFLSLAGLPECDITDCPDLLPLLAAVACAKQGETAIRGTGRLKTKESDRASGVVKLITDLGGSAEARDDSVVVHGSGGLRGGRCDPRNDHRLAFAAAVMAMISAEPVTVDGAECVKKSAPGFWEDLKAIGF